MAKQKKRYQIDCSKDGKTKQEFSKQCNINTIMSQAMKGIMPNYRQDENYIDTTGLQSYQEALYQVREAERQFNLMPAELRNKFDNNPQRMIDWVNQEENKAEAIELGMLPRETGVQPEGKPQSKDPESDPKTPPEGGE